MKFVIKLLLIGVGTFFALQFFPWWMIIIIPFAINLIVKTKGSGAFLSSLLGIFLAWFIASYTLYSAGAEAFTTKMARVFTLNVSGLVFLMITAAVMALVGALAGFSGNAFRNIFVKPKDKTKNKYGRPDYSQYSR
jgi:hypothetical protein